MLHPRRILLALLVGLVAPPLSLAEKLDKPVAISVQKTDKTHVAGKVQSYDDDGMEVSDNKGQTQTVRWDELDAKTVYATRQKFLGPRDASGYVELGKLMLGVDAGQPFADKAFAAALKLDPNLKEQIDQAKADGPPKKHRPGAEKPEGEENKSDSGEQSAASGNGGPLEVGEVDKKYWGPLTDAEQADSVDPLKKFADRSAKTINRPLQLLETKYFLFYSDLAPREAANWAGLLDRMYDRLATLFGVEKGKNVWRGKALIFVFSKDTDYRQFQMRLHSTDPGESAGMCHAFGDGIVHIAFYRQANQLEFAHVLVHESVHGFLHRYRSAANIPSWANEGLAEVIADELVPQTQRTPQAIPQFATRLIERHGWRLGRFFDTDHIEGWQYPVAESLTTFMIRQSKKNYVDFINGIKDGLPWEQSLEKRYNAPRDRLVGAYAKSMGIQIKD